MPEAVKNLSYPITERWLQHHRTGKCMPPQLDQLTFGDYLFQKDVCSNTYSFYYEQASKKRQHINGHYERLFAREKDIKIQVNKSLFQRVKDWILR